MIMGSFPLRAALPSMIMCRFPLNATSLPHDHGTSGRGHVAYAGTPFEVSYLVAVWQR
jgi:hypothetical protein